MSARLQEHTQKFARADEISTHKKVRLILQAQLQPDLVVLSGGTEKIKRSLRNTKVCATGTNSMLATAETIQMSS